MENPAFNQQQKEGVKNLLNGDILGNIEEHLKSLNAGLQTDSRGRFVKLGQIDLSDTSPVGDSDRLTATSMGFDLRVSSDIIDL